MNTFELIGLPQATPYNEQIAMQAVSGNQALTGSMVEASTNISPYIFRPMWAIGLAAIIVAGVRIVRSRNND